IAARDVKGCGAGARRLRCTRYTSATTPCIRCAVSTCAHSSARCMMNRPVVLLAAVWVVWGPAPAAADPTVQTLEPSRPSTPALDDQFLADLARAGIGVTDV